jgi:hypothetical protein
MHERMRCVFSSALAAVALIGAASCGSTPSRTTPAPTPVPTAASVSVTCDATALSTVGQQAHCQARLTLSDGSSSDQTAAAQWTSSNSSSVSVASGGVVSAIAIGSADISATVSGVTGKQSVTVSVACTFSASPAALSFPSTGGSQAVTIAVSPGGCSSPAWTASATGGLTVSPVSGSGNAGVTVTAPVNAGGEQTATATIAGQAITATIAAAPKPPHRALTVTLLQGEALSGPHAGYVTGPNGFSCTLGQSDAQKPCAPVLYADGATITLTVTVTVLPTDNPIFGTTGCDTGTYNTCTVTMNADRSVTIRLGCAVCGEPEPPAEEPPGV